mmetsp:Transcript_134321/g.318416  ORF Transcript_134321/g.318416 Transcript_134321/m.318416 type:complete len:217 (-) Transcript_134321:868-1518(-)
MLKVLLLRKGQRLQALRDLCDASAEVPCRQPSFALLVFHELHEGVENAHLLQPGQVDGRADLRAQLRAHHAQQLQLVVVQSEAPVVQEEAPESSLEVPGKTLASHEQVQVVHALAEGLTLLIDVCHNVADLAQHIGPAEARTHHHEGGHQSLQQVLRAHVPVSHRGHGVTAEVKGGHIDTSWPHGGSVQLVYLTNVVHPTWILLRNELQGQGPKAC